MNLCPPRKLTSAVGTEVQTFYATMSGECLCPLTLKELGAAVHMAYLDDDPAHSYLHNLVPLHPTLNQHLGGLKRNYGSPAKMARRCDYPQLEWCFPREQAMQHRRLWRFRLAYACVRIAWYVYTRYFAARPALRYEIMTECLYYARHVWCDELIWALLIHDAEPLLQQDVREVPRAQVSPLVEQLAALWTEIRRVEEAHSLLELVPIAVQQARADGSAMCSSLRRHAMDAAAFPTLDGLSNAEALAAEAVKLAPTFEAHVNALEVQPWALESRNDWKQARTSLQERLAPDVLKKVQPYIKDLVRRRAGGQLGKVPLKIPNDLTPLNAAQVPIELAAAIVNTGGTTGRELRKAKELVETSLLIYEPLGAQPFMLTGAVRLGYERLAAVISDPRLTAVAKGRVLSEATLAVLRRVRDLAATRLREAKS